MEAISLVLPAAAALGVVVAYWHGEDRAWAGVRGVLYGAASCATVLGVAGLALYGVRLPLVGVVIGGFIIGLLPAWLGTRRRVRAKTPR